MIDFENIMLTLAESRCVFHAEADFQHAVAWELHRRLPEANVRLELPIRVDSEKLHLDIWLSHEGYSLAVELKYKTRALTVSVDGEEFALSSHGAQDLGRYDYIKDVQRIEQVVARGACSQGYAVFLTNDSAYWSDSSGRTVDAGFRLHDGRVLQGELRWDSHAGAGTIRGRERPLRLKSEYPIQWQDYSRVESARYSVFRYACVHVDARR